MVTALITGAGRGMGLEFTRQLLDRGDTVIATVRNPARADALRELAANRGDHLAIVTLDVSDPASITRATFAIAQHTDHLDLLVNNAGINSRGVPEGQGNVRFGSLEPEGILRTRSAPSCSPRRSPACCRRAPARG